MTLFRNLVLAFALLIAGLVSTDAANRFGVCTVTCTWDGASTAMWSASTGGATGASVPGSGDAVIFDAATCVGSVTCTITVNTTVAVQSITWGACTAATTGCIIDFSANNNNVTISNLNGFSGSGSGTRKFLCGTGTYTFTNTTLNGTPWTMTTTTNLDAGSVFSTCTIIYSGSVTGVQNFAGGGLSYGTVSFTAGNRNPILLSGSNTIATLNVTAPMVIQFSSATTTTITNALNLVGTAAGPIFFTSNSATGLATISSGNNPTSLTWMAFRLITFAGAATWIASNSFDLGTNSNITISPPSGGGGGGGGRCIGC